MEQKQLKRFHSLLLHRRKKLFDYGYEHQAWWDKVQKAKMAQNARSGKQSKLEEINTALRKIESGVYGKCEICDGPVGIRRMQLQPLARLCIDCARNQDALEESHRVLSRIARELVNEMTE